jgi:magnesium transporter
MTEQPPSALHAPETAGHLATTQVPRATAADTVAAVRRQIRSGPFASIELVIVTHDDGRYLGVVVPRQLLEASDTATMGELAARNWPTVTPATDQEHAVATARTTPSVAVPVVDGSGEVIGVLTSKSLIEVLSAEHREDMDRLVGILRDSSNARQALEDPPFRRFRRRLPWLLVGLAMSSVATAVMASFEHTLKKHVMIAFFIPAIVYLTDAIGTQTEAVAIRGLSARHRPLASVLWSEFVTGALIGTTLGIIAALGIWMFFGSLSVGLGVGLSVIAAGAMASVIGITLPWLLSRFGMDPAFGAGPVATILQDVLTIAIYFVIMTHIIGTGD